MNFSKKDYKRAIKYWASGQYKLWKELQVAKVKIKQLERMLADGK